MCKKSLADCTNITTRRKIMSSLSGVQSDASINAVEEDSTGPSYIIDSGVYDAVIDMAYIMKSQSSKALGLNLKLKTREGTMITERIWFTNKNGQTYYTREGQNIALPGFAQLNALSNLVAGKNFLDLADQVQEKQVMIYNRDQGKEVATPSEVVVPLIGRKVKIGVIRAYEDIGDANNGYAPSGYSREVNSVDKFFDAEKGRTHGELVESKDAAFIEKWKAKNAGITRDRTENKIGLNPKPKGNSSAVPNNLQSSNSPNQQPAASLFNNNNEASATADSDIPF